MKGPLSSINSPPITTSDNEPSERLSREDAEGLLECVLHDGDETIKEMIRLIWEEDGIDLETFYRDAVRIEEKIRQDENLPPLNLPPWEDVAPTT